MICENCERLENMCECEKVESFYNSGSIANYKDLTINNDLMPHIKEINILHSIVN